MSREEMTGLIQGMRAALSERMTAFSRAGEGDISYLQDKKSWGVNLFSDPLYLLWDGDGRFGYLVRLALAQWNVIGILNVPHGHDFYGMKFTSEADFREAKKAHPNLVAVGFCEDGRYENLCADVGVRYANLAMMRRAAGEFSLSAQCAPHLRANLSVFDGLADDLSKATLLATQLYRVTEEKRWLDPILCPQGEMYFGFEGFSYRKDEVFVDGGGALGDTVEGFANTTKGIFRHIHSFEPGPVGAGLMRRWFKNDNRISVHQLGLSNKSGLVPFSTNVDAGGAINGVYDPRSKDQITTEMMDCLDLGPVTFIKLDIEGFEVEALEGARRTIERHKPKLAICAYHKPRDFFEIAKVINGIRSDYKMHLRHYTPTYGDSVYYCV